MRPPDPFLPGAPLAVSEQLRLELTLLEGGRVADDDVPEAARPTVLVASEHADLRAYVRACLQPLAVHVVEAGDGVAVRAGLLAHPVDLVLADVALPGLDGFALARMLQSAPPGRRIGLVLMTDDPSAAAGARAAGAGLLPLPFNAATLCARVRAALGDTRA